MSSPTEFAGSSVVRTTSIYPFHRRSPDCSLGTSLKVPTLALGGSPLPLFTEVRGIVILGSSLSAYRASTGPGYPSGYPGPSVANILRRGGRPPEVRHVPDNKGVGCRGGDNLVLDALPTVPLYEANRGGGAARGGVAVARGARPTAVLLRPQAGLAGAPALYLLPGRV